MSLYDVARSVCHDAGLDWTDPRTGRVHAAPKAKKPNKAAQALGRLGGLKSTEAKRKANAKKIRQFWAGVRAGKRPAPRKRGKAK